MYVRATPSFHKQPWFNDVCIQMEATREQKNTSYGQLHLLFKVTYIEVCPTCDHKELCIFAHVH